MKKTPGDDVENAWVSYGCYRFLRWNTCIDVCKNTVTAKPKRQEVWVCHRKRGQNINRKNVHIGILKKGFQICK